MPALLAAPRLPSAPAILGSMLAFAALFASSPALAGGIGLVGSAGLHGDRVYGYTGAVQNAPETEMNANYGTGLELTLGDKDNKITGVFRFSYLQDGPETPPTNTDPGDYAIRTGTRDIGIFEGGLQWGIVGDPTRLQFTAVSYLGSGFLTKDFTEFAEGEAGIGGTFNPARHVQIFAEATGGIRYRKRVYPMTNATLGVRYLFD